MIFFNNAKFLLFLICSMSSFQALPSFLCCGDDTTIDTRIKSDKQTVNKSNFSVAAAIAQNQQLHEEIARLQPLNQDKKPKSQTSSDSTSYKRSDLASIMLQHEQNKKRIAEHQNNPKKIEQNNSLNSQNSIARSNPAASSENLTNTGQIYTEIHFFNSTNQETSTNASNNKNPISSQEHYISQSNNNIVVQKKSNSSNSQMSELVLPPPALPFENSPHAISSNSFNTPIEINVCDEYIAHDEYQDYQTTPKLIGVIRVTTAKRLTDPNQALKGRIIATKDLPSPILSPLVSMDSEENNLPHMPVETFNDNNQF